MQKTQFKITIDVLKNHFLDNDKNKTKTYEGMEIIDKAYAYYGNVVNDIIQCNKKEASFMHKITNLAYLVITLL